MKIIIIWLAAFSLAPAMGASQPVPFTGKDMWALSRKLSNSLKKCKPLRAGGEVVVDVQNATAEFVDKTRFSELIHSMIEGKTHARPETIEPDFEIQARLTSLPSSKWRAPGTTYTLSAELLQGGEKLCAKSVSISKLGSMQNGKK